MKRKSLTIAVLLIMILSSFGVTGTNLKLRYTSSCGYTCQVEDSYENYNLEDLCGLVIPEEWEDDANFKYYDSTSIAGLPPFYDLRRTTPTNKNSAIISNFPKVGRQGGCGSCWAFATNGVLEIAIRLKLRKTVDLSEQYLISCNPYGYDCSGGFFVYKLYKKDKNDKNRGAVLESDFLPYTGNNESCELCNTTNRTYVIKDYVYIRNENVNERINAIKQAIITYGPISAGVSVDDGFRAYTGGVFSSNTSGIVNHAIVLVGWQDDPSIPDGGYWILRNSWGDFWWGENEYFQPTNGQPGSGGYMRITYKSSSVGYRPCYIVGPDTNAKSFTQQNFSHIFMNFKELFSFFKILINKTYF